MPTPGRSEEGGDNLSNCLLICSYVYPISTLRWVEAVEHMTNAQGDGNTWFRAYRPSLDDGWYWLGQSLDGRYALQVRENGSQGGALGPVRDANLIHKNEGSKAKGKFMLSTGKVDRSS